MSLPVKWVKDDTYSVHTKSLQSCLTLCDPIDYSPPGSSVHWIPQARILEWVGIPSSGDLPNPGIRPPSIMSPALANGFFTANATWETLLMGSWKRLNEISYRQ